MRRSATQVSMCNSSSRVSSGDSRQQSPRLVEVHREVAAMKILVSILSQAVRPHKMWIKNVKMLKYDKRCQLLIVLKKAALKSYRHKISFRLVKNVKESGSEA